MYDLKKITKALYILLYHSSKSKQILPYFRDLCNLFTFKKALQKKESFFFTSESMKIECSLSPSNILQNGWN